MVMEMNTSINEKIQWWIMRDGIPLHREECMWQDRGEQQQEGNELRASEAYFATQNRRFKTLPPYYRSGSTRYGQTKAGKKSNVHSNTRIQATAFVWKEKASTKHQ
jgi:hypothetical protein